MDNSDRPHCGGSCEIKGEPECLYHLRRLEGRCGRCGQWPAICGHDLSFKDRIKSVSVDKSSLR